MSPAIRSGDIVSVGEVLREGLPYGTHRPTAEIPKN